MIVFSWTIGNASQLTHVVKRFEALKSQSDTALFKVLPKAIHVKQTDYESFACFDLRISGPALKAGMVLRDTHFSAKILLPSLIRILQDIRKAKRTAVLFASARAPHILQVKSSAGDVFRVDSAETRARCFYLLSAKKFSQQHHPALAEFRFPAHELNRVVTRLAILSGVKGGIMRWSYRPVRQGRHTHQISMTVKSASAIAGGVHVYTTGHETADVHVLRAPAKPLHTRVLLTFLKRSQSIFSPPTEFVRVLLSAVGVVIVTEGSAQQHHMPVTMFIRDVDRPEKVDLDSYA